MSNVVHLQTSKLVLVRNTHKVARRQWAKWSGSAQAVFNSVYSQMMDNPEFFLHPKTAPLPRLEWRTVAHNAAWIAADAVDGK